MRMKLLLFSFFILGHAIASGAIRAPQKPTPGYYKTETYEGQGLKIDHLWWAPVNVGYIIENPYGLLYTQSSTEIDDGIVPLPHGKISHTPFYDPESHWEPPFQGPCPDGWRLPTEAEYKNLFRYENSPGYKIYSKHRGKWQGGTEKKDKPNDLAGRWFGPDCQTATSANPSEAVFFPAAGYWHYFDHKCIYRDYYGMYWTSAPGRMMFIDKNRTRVGGSYDYKRESNALSVRCVQDSEKPLSEDLIATVIPVDPLEKEISAPGDSTQFLRIPGYYKTNVCQGQGVNINGIWWAPVNVGYTVDNPAGLLYTQSSMTSSDGIRSLSDNTVGAGPSYDSTSHWTSPFQGPCPDGWRVPTEAEYKNLLGSEGGQWRSARLDNPDGLAGRWFGPDCKTATVTAPSNSVFFPAVGLWHYIHGEFFYKGNSGLYWSSASGVFLKFYSGINASVESYTVNNGYSVRCVQN